MSSSNVNQWPLGSAIHAAQRAVALITVLVVESHDDETARVLTASLLREYGEPQPDLNSTDIRELRHGAQDIYAIFRCPDMGSTVEHINALLARYATSPRLTSHDNSPWHLHVDATDNAPWRTWFVSSSAMALAILASEKQRPPGGICASPSCERPFINLGQGGGRRYCSSRCSTRERVASHRRKPQ